MGEIRDFYPFKLVIGILMSCIERRTELTDELIQHFGKPDYQSEDFEFNFTDYYAEEMGSHIRRFFISFEDLVAPDTLSDIKIETNRIEEGWAFGGKRKVNLDPGILSLSRFILATTKDNVHRIPLKKGIFGEVTLIYERHAFRDLPWTYADFRSEGNKKALDEIRKIYKEQLKALGKQGHS
ncbi:MAG TPA: DUF4416 family protein [Spirochaetia bacterium]|nr:DUF4416 family protein [Spirochaetia bacterium]